MSDESDSGRGFTLKRREFLSSAAIPVAAALAPAALLAQERASSGGTVEPIRVGIIGAGGIVSSVHVPGLKRQPGVELVSVANRSLESSRRAADELGIRNAYANWEELLAAGGLDAVLIGTWPYMHKAITLAALDEGLHVLCQARMANDAAEARDMLAASQRHPLQICQLVPSSGTYRIDRALQRLLGERFVGDLLSVEVQMLQRGFASFEGELDWRHDPEFSGVNVLNVGGTYESAMRWRPWAKRHGDDARADVPTRRGGDDACATRRSPITSKCCTS
jgi:hypothetical protein